MSDEKSNYQVTQFYHATQGVRVVRSAAEEAALGPGWHDSPKKVVGPIAPAASAAPTGAPPKKTKGRAAGAKK